MKKLILLCGAALIALWAMPAMAGDYHTGTTLVCSDCHTMHFSQSHGYNADGSGIFTPLGPAGPYDGLIRNEVNALCLTCHDNQAFAPDVLEANSNGFVREAGGLNKVGGTGNYHLDNGHTLFSTDVAPGGTWSDAEGLNCADCHTAHGSGTTAIPNPYRNLTRRSGGSTHETVSYAHTTNTPTTVDVFEVSPADYHAEDVHFNEPLTTGSRVADWCKSCHTNFHGATGGAEVGGGTVAYHRHPNADANFSSSMLTQYNSHANQVKVMSPTGVWSPAPTEATPMCLTCHKGHGNQNAFGLIFMSGTGDITEEGDTGGTGVRSLCKQCHTQGGAN